MCSISQVVDDILSQHPPCVGLVEDDDLVEQLPPERPNDPLAVRVLPRASRCDGNVLHAHRPDGARDGVAVDAVPVSVKEARCAVEWKGVAKLLSRPDRRRVGGYRDMPDSATAVLEDDEAVEQLERRRRDDEEA